MSRSWRDDVARCVSLPGAICVAAGGWMWLAARHCGGEARRVGSARELDCIADARTLAAAAAAAAAGSSSSSSSKNGAAPSGGAEGGAGGAAAGAAAAAAALPALVAVRGRVACPDPRPCELSGRKAAIHEIVEHDVMLVRAPSGALERKPLRVRQEAGEREWYVVDDSRAALRVVGGRDACASELATALESSQEVVEPDAGGGGGVRRAAMQAVGELVTGGRRIGRVRTETFLGVGAAVTVVGELARDSASSAAAAVSGGGGVSSGGSGAAFGPFSSTGGGGLFGGGGGGGLLGGGGGGLQTLRLQLRAPAPGGGPLYITARTLPELRLVLAQRATLYLRVAACLGGVGALLLLRKAARVAWVRYQERAARLRVRRALQQQQLEREQRRRQRAAANGQAAAAGDGDVESQQGGSDDGGGGGGPEGVGSSGSRDDGDRSSSVCVVCLSARTDMVFVPCGHLCCCARCCAALPSPQRCPVCRSRGNAVRVYAT